MNINDTIFEGMMFGPVTRIRKKFGPVPGSKVGDKSLGCLVSIEQPFNFYYCYQRQSWKFAILGTLWTFAHYDVNKEKQCSHISTIGMSFSNSNHSQNGLHQRCLVMMQIIHYWCSSSIWLNHRISHSAPLSLFGHPNCPLFIAYQPGDYVLNLITLTLPGQKCNVYPSCIRHSPCFLKSTSKSTNSILN